MNFLCVWISSVFIFSSDVLFVLFHMCVVFVVVGDVFRCGGGGELFVCLFVLFCFGAMCVCFHAGKMEDLNRKTCKPGISSKSNMYFL